MAKRRKLREQVLGHSPGCIYCAGRSAADTVDHMPPIVMFGLRQRPKGLEFPSCAACNTGAKHADLVAAYVGRIYPDPPTPEEEVETGQLLSALMSNIPGLVPELQSGRGASRLAHKRLGIGEDQGGFLRLGGPLVLSHLEAFAARLGFAMHFHETGEALPEGGAVAVRVFSNIEMMEGKIPDLVYGALPEPSTLRMGNFDVGEQFRYSSRGDGKGRVLSFASFRRAFSTLAVSATDASFLEEGLRIFRPGELRVRPGGSYWIRATFKVNGRRW